MDNVKKKKPIVLVILDGWGEWDIEKGNPFVKAKLPVIEELNAHYPKIYLQASGMAVGLPWGVRGNSEVGHQTIGSGQIVFQFLPTISSAVSDGSFFKNEALLAAFEWAKKNNSNLHVLGLLSDGAVHSHIEHLFALLEMAKNNKVKEVFIHAITDGRDTHPQSAKKFLTMLENKIKEIGLGKIATISGRYFTMDRNNNWDRIEKSFLALTAGIGITEKNAHEAIDSQYERGIFDEYLEPVILTADNGEPVALIKENDAVICFNFRRDRSRQITKAFVKADFKEFKRAKRPQNIKFVCFAPYEEGLPVEVAFVEQQITVRLGEILAKNWKRQLRISETEKYAHVTYFFNGGMEEPFFYEDRILIPSKQVRTYADAPEMSATEITEKLIAAMGKNNYDFILVNYANSDMVGHTGNYAASVRALEHVDGCLEKLISAVVAKGGELIITADHGNVEELLNIYTGEPDTQHSKNVVPCWYVSAGSRIEKTDSAKKIEAGGLLVDLAPTILDLLGLEKNSEMTGSSLLRQFEKMMPEKDDEI
ncbi:MAG: 2,3-bisphosphoglycerate-independent phosphoglycerate mutase [Patescibacteria group bacterium]|nr:2,3-bisphosphoglycerate-independent phosphoglycerate mutase [Patescibacteria group bacterium]